MKEALISDIHSDPERLYTALRLLKQTSYDRMRCLGDTIAGTVSKEKESHECVDAVRQSCDAWILGNHDKEATFSKRFSNSRIREYLERAQVLIREEDTSYTHADPTKPTGPFGFDSYINTPERAKEVFEGCDDRVIFVGHTHIPQAFSSDGRHITFEQGGSIVLDKKLRWILSPGAVGFSRDSNRAVSCAVYDSDKATFTVIRG